MKQHLSNLLHDLKKSKKKTLVIIAALVLLIMFFKDALVLMGLLVITIITTHIINNYNRNTAVVEQICKVFLECVSSDQPYFPYCTRLADGTELK